MINAGNFPGFLAFVFLLSVPLAILLGVVIRKRYRRAIGRAMMLHVDGADTAFDIPAPDHPNAADLSFEVAPLDRRSTLRTGLALRYFLSGLAFALVTMVVMFWLNGFAFEALRVGAVTAALAFPGLVMALYVSGSRWPVIAGGALLWLGLLYLATPLSLTVFGLLVGPALLLAVLVGNPGLRTTAVPLFLVAVALVVPLVFSLEAILWLMTVGVFDRLFDVLPGAWVMTLYYALGVGGTLALGAAVALAAVRLVAVLTARSSEFTMQNDLVWAFQSFWLTGLAWTEFGAMAALYATGFVAYRATLRALRPTGAAREIGLLLRVFGQPGRQRDLARGLLLDWRQHGPVLLIGAEDLATETIDAPELAAFLSGRLDRVFIATPADLARVRDAGEVRLGDGLFPMQDYYCRDNSWRATALTLMTRARRVLVDMRGFDPTRRGIRFEIDALAERVPTDCITVLADAVSLPEVERLFRDAWRRAGAPGTAPGTGATLRVWLA